MFAAFHNCDVDPEVNSINVRCLRATNDDMEKAVRHANNTPGDSDEDDEQAAQSTRFPCVPCRLVIVSMQEFADRLCDAEKNFQSDGVLLESRETTTVNKCPIFRPIVGM